jgi:uncharacterized cupredoxin-like copper-binding protein
MGCTSLRTRTRQLRTPIRKPSNREQHERLRSHVSTISLDADAYQKAPAPSAGSSYIPPIHSEFPHWGDGVIRATREDWHGDTSLTHLPPQVAAHDNRRGRLSSQPERPKNSVQNANEMADRNETLRLAPFNIIIAAIAISSAALAQAQEVATPEPSIMTKPAEVRIVSTEFKFAPANVRVTAGRMVTLVLDNSGGETEHGLFVPGLGFRLQAKAGEIARNSTVFVKPGEYKFICDLPGHQEAGMNGTLIVGPFGPADELPSISGGVQKYTGGTVRPALLQRE